MKTKTQYLIEGQLMQTKRPGIKNLLRFLSASDFYIAPASASQHLSCEGGLALHSWLVFLIMKEVNALYGLCLDHDSIAISALLHDLCKINTYRKTQDGYKVIDDMPLGHGEKSVILIQRCMRLTDAEILAIRWHMGAWETPNKTDQTMLNAAIKKEPMTRALIIADQISTLFIEGENGRKN